MSTILCNEKNGLLERTVRVEIDGDCLKISGHDIESVQRENARAYKYQYSYTLDKYSTQRLYSVLSKGSGEFSLLNLVAENFGGMNGCRKLREICMENDIPFSFSSS